MPESLQIDGGSSDDEEKKFDRGVGLRKKMSAKLGFKHAKGVSKAARDTVSFISDERILHPVGKQLCIFDVEDKNMLFFQKSSKTAAITSVCLSPNLKIAAVCETLSNGNTNQVTVYHVGKRKRLRILSYPSSTTLGTSDDQTGSVFEHLAFSGDSKFLITTTSEPDSVLMYWKWESEKMIAHGKGASSVTRVRLHPKDSSIATTSGPGMFRQWRLGSDFSIKPHAVLPSKQEHQKFADHMWTEDAMLVLMTESGIAYVFKLNEELSLELIQTLKSPISNEHMHVESLCPFNSGFIACGGHGYLGVYERIDERKEPFMFIKSIASSKNEHIASLAISPNGEKAVCFSTSNELLSLPIHNIDALEDANISLSPLHPGGFHVGSVHCMDVCSSKPLLVTGGKDKVVRIVNFATWESVMSEKMNEDILSVAIHPSGYMVLVSVRDRVRIYSVLVNRMKLKAEVVANKVRDMRFASGGQYFACASGISVVVYETYSRAPLCTFVGHIGPVKRVVWSNEDRVLLSAGNDGCIYAWHIETKSKMERLCYAVSSCQQNGMVVNKDLTRVAMCSSDSKLREVCDGEEVCEARIDAATPKSPSSGMTTPSAARKLPMNAKGETATDIALHPTETVLFVGTSNGAVRVYAWPLSSSECQYAEYALHTSSVTKLRFSGDGKYLFSSGNDGSVFMSEIIPTVDGSERPYPSLGISTGVDEDVLVSIDDLAETTSSITELKKKIQDMKSDHDYTSHVKEAQWSDQLKRQKEEADAALKLEVNHFEKLQTRHEETVRTNIEELERINAEHVKVTQELSNEYEHKLADEMNRYDVLSEAMERMRQRCESLLGEQDAEHRERVVSLEMESNARIEKLNAAVDKLQRQIADEKVRSVAMLNQQESEYELEVLQLTRQKESRDDGSREAIAALQNQLAQEVNKRNKLQSRITEMRSTRAEDEKTIAQLNEDIQDLRVVVRRSEQSLSERDATLSDKEQAIATLRKQNQTLEHFRFVLDHRIAKLEAEKGPVSAEMEKLKKATGDRDAEFAVEFHAKKNRAKEFHIARERLEKMSKEIKSLRAHSRDNKIKMVNLRADLESICKIPNPKNLAAEVKKLYAFISKSDDFFIGDDNPEAHSQNGATEEIKRQQQFMQQTVASLKRSLKLAEEKLRQKTVKNVEENSLLVNECNVLRRRTVVQNQKIQSMEQKLKRMSRDAGSARASSDSSQKSLRGYSGGHTSKMRSFQSLLASEGREEEDRLDATSGGSASPSSPAFVDLDEVFDGPSKHQRGRSSPMTAQSQAKEVVNHLLRQLDESNREIEMQRIEIRRLRAGMVTEYLEPIGSAAGKRCQKK